MKKIFSYILILGIILPAYSFAQLQRNPDGTYNIGTLDSTGTILNQDVSPVNLESKDGGINRIVTLDEEKKNITSSEVEVEDLQTDQSIALEKDIKSIVDVSSYFQVANSTKEEAKEAVKKDVQNEFQKALDDLKAEDRSDELSDVIEMRTQLFKDIDDYFKTESFVTNPDAIAELNEKISSTFTDVEDAINSGEGDEFTFSILTINETLLTYKANLEERTNLFADRAAEVLIDSDGDGLSDFDEVNIYNTDPNNAYTVGGKLNDKEKIIAGIDPLSEDGAPIVYEDPRLDRDAVEVMSYTVLGVDFVPANQTKTGLESLTIRGTALPNSLVTIYIFSNPIVITTETDAEGKWEHALGRELENGEHTAYITTTDNKGRMLAKGEPVLLSKSAQAAAIGVLVAQPASTDVDTFFDEYSFLILLLLFLAGVAVTISLIVKTRQEAAKENLFVPIHPGATPFIPDQDSARQMPTEVHHDSLYPNLNKKDGGIK